MLTLGLLTYNITSAILSIALLKGVGIMPRKTRQVETRLVSEYLEARYNKFITITNQPLGIVPKSLLEKEGYAKALGISRPFRPAVDAVVILPRHLIIIEAKVFEVINGLAKLPMYKSLVPVTPELKQYMPREVLMQLVVGWTNPNLEIMARDASIAVKLFHPPWLQEVVERRHRYWTPEYRQKRAEKQRMREYLGLD
jgi:hypothetical protein